MSELAYLTDLVKTLIDEVKTLRVENKQLHEKFDSFKDQIKPKRTGATQKKPVADRVQCKAIAASSGNRCKCRAKDGKDVCDKHDRQHASPPQTSECPPPDQKKKPRVKKPVIKKPVPVHNHPIGEPPGDGIVCELCEQHGDIFDPDVVDADFEVIAVDGLSIEDRLRIMLENEDA